MNFGLSNITAMNLAVRNIGAEVVLGNRQTRILKLMVTTLKDVVAHGNLSI